MKTLSLLVICLVLSLTLAGQAKARQGTLPIDGINKVLQMKIDQELLHSLGDDLYFQQNHQFSLPVKQDKFQHNQPDSFSVPDCLCHLFTRVL